MITAPNRLQLSLCDTRRSFGTRLPCHFCDPSISSALAPHSTLLCFRFTHSPLSSQRTVQRACAPTHAHSLRSQAACEKVSAAAAGRERERGMCVIREELFWVLTDNAVSPPSSSGSGKTPCPAYTQDSYKTQECMTIGICPRKTHLPICFFLSGFQRDHQMHSVHIT